MSNVTCRFCGERRSRAKEHAWPQWLLETTNLSDALTRETHAGIAGEVVDARVQSFQSMRDGRVCATCNNTWMSDLENATKPIIENVITSGNLYALDDDEKSRLAVWSFKTAIVRNAVTNYRKIVPETHYTYLYDHRAVAPAVYVDAAICPMHKGLSGRQSQTLFGFVKPGDTSQTISSAGLYNIVLAIESILLRVIYFPLQGYKVRAAPTAAAQTFRLHPQDHLQPVLPLESYADYGQFELDAYFVGNKEEQ